MTAKDDSSLSQIEHPEREYVHVVHAFPDEVQKQILGEALVEGFSQLLQKRASEKPMQFLEAVSTGVYRNSVEEENHRKAEGIA